MSYGLDRLLGGSHLLHALGLDNLGMMDQLNQFENQLEVLQELRDNFQRTGGGMSALMLAGMLQNGGIAAPGMMPPPNMFGCACPGHYAQPQQIDFGASQNPWSIGGLMQRAQGARFERFLQTN